MVVVDYVQCFVVCFVVVGGGFGLVIVVVQCVFLWNFVQQYDCFGQYQFGYVVGVGVWCVEYWYVEFFCCYQVDLVGVDVEVVYCDQLFGFGQYFGGEVIV